MLIAIVILLTLFHFAFVCIYCHGGVWPVLARFLARPAVANWLIRRAQRRPYSPIIKSGKLYMDRWWLFNPYPDTGASGVYTLFITGPYRGTWGFLVGGVKVKWRDYLGLNK